MEPHDVILVYAAAFLIYSPLYLQYTDWAKTCLSVGIGIAILCAKVFS